MRILVTRSAKLRPKIGAVEMKQRLAAAVVLGMALSSNAGAQPSDTAAFAATTLVLSASGEVRVQPDLAVLNLGVQADGPDAAQAFARARTRTNALFATLRDQGVADTDIQTDGLNLQAQYAEQDSKGPAVLTGYRASNTVKVRLHDISHAGAVVDAVVSAGANQVNGISFELSNPSVAEDEARRLAVKALQAKAELYAEATGYRVRRLISLSEGGGGYAGPVYPVVAMRRMTAETPVAAGEATVSATVSATFELAR
jgi:uncharacterized protein YggE